MKKSLDSIKGLEFNKIEIHGHVCCSDNHKMSLDRAIIVKKQFVNAGINENLISCFGHSNKYPIVVELTNADTQINRRVEVILFQ